MKILPRIHKTSGPRTDKNRERRITYQIVVDAYDEECMREMFVMIRWGRRRLAVPLSQLQTLRATAKTRQAVEDWHYWIKQGYRF